MPPRCVGVVITDIMMRRARCTACKSKPPMTRPAPDELPKITKYSVASPPTARWSAPIRMMRHTRDDDGLEAIQRTTLRLTAARRECHAAHRGAPLQGAAPAEPDCAAAAAPRHPRLGPAPSTSCMKISSAVHLLRMLSTSMPSADRRAKMSLRFSSSIPRFERVIGRPESRRNPPDAALPRASRAG